MFKIKTYIFSLFFIFLSFLGFVFYQVSEGSSLTSPLGKTLGLKISENVWFPKDNNLAFSDAPEISAQAAFFIETNTGEVLFEKNSREKLPIASLVKIMTAIVALERRDILDNLVVSEKAASMEPDKMFLIPGEKLKLEELLAGVFLISANDASEVLAEGITGSREEFVGLMNQKAIQLGLKNTNFINPSGLDEDPEQISTAYEVAVMSRYAIKHYPKLVEITKQPHVYLPQTDFHQSYDLFSGINLITTYPGVVGFKTGYTPKAGLTLVTLARKEDKEVLGVLLNAISRRDDARALLDYSFKKLGI